MHRVDPYVVALPGAMQGGHLAQVGHGCLARAVRGSERNHHLGGVGGNIDDGASTVLLHQTNCLAGTEETADQVHLQYSPEILQAEVLDGSGQINTGIIDQNVESTESLFNLCQDTLPIGFVGNVMIQVMRAEAAHLELLAEASSSVAENICQHYAGSVLCQYLGRSRS
ncbi:hypothetical protein D9M70_463580 [compost metagenome]